jgi:type VI secretion system protein ImpI
MTLAVQLKGPAPESNKTLRFTESPVRIGRNQLNDISLDDPFVSEWHGIIRFTAQDVAYFDLGSTNGSILDGQRLQKNVGAPLTSASRLQLGRIELSIAPPQSPFAPSPPQPQEEPGPSKTLGWGQEFFRPGGVSNTGPGSSGGAVSRSNVATPPPSAAAAFHPAGGVATPPGNLAPSAVSRSNVVTPPPVSAAHAITPPPGAASATTPGEAAALGRTRKLLEAFCEAFVGLRKGYEQFGAEVGVRTISGWTPLHRARSSREVLDYLLQPGLDLNAATRDLIGIFADFGIHHIAMMEAVTEGVRSMLQSLTPPEKKSQWKEYVERFEHAINDDQELHDGIFGAEFARAYATVAVGEAAKPGPAGQAGKPVKPGTGRG